MMMNMCSVFVIRLWDILSSWWTVAPRSHDVRKYHTFTEASIRFFLSDVRSVWVTQHLTISSSSCKRLLKTRHFHLKKFLNRWILRMRALHSQSCSCISAITTSSYIGRESRIITGKQKLFAINSGQQNLNETECLCCLKYLADGINPFNWRRNFFVCVSQLIKWLGWNCFIIITGILASHFNRNWIQWTLAPYSNKPVLCIFQNHLKFWSLSLLILLVALLPRVI